MNKPSQSIRYVSRELTARLHDSQGKEEQILITTTLDRCGSVVEVSIPSYNLILFVMLRGDKFRYSFVKCNYLSPDNELVCEKRDISEELTNKEIVDMCMEEIDSARDLYQGKRIRI